jgi:hypothetical protein
MSCGSVRSVGDEVDVVRPQGRKLIEKSFSDER